MLLMDRIARGLLAEAELALQKADHYRSSKRVGERHSAPVYVRRGREYLEALELIENLTERN